jgi:hypothetical protein
MTVALGDFGRQSGQEAITLMNMVRGYIKRHLRALFLLSVLSGM